MNFSFAILNLILLLIVNCTLFGQPYNLKTEREAILFGFGVSTGGTGFFLERNVAPLSASEIKNISKSEVNSIDRSACNNYNTFLGSISDVSVITLMATPTLLFLSDDISTDFGTVSTMYLQTLMFIYALPSVSKGSIKRPRPYVYNPEAPTEKKLGQDAVKSYFSGHTTAAFASAVFLSTVYSDYFPGSKYKGWIWAGSILAAATIGYLRYESGNHFPTDVISGAIVGSAIGFLIPYLHRQVGDKNITPSANNSGGFSVGFSYSF